MDKKVCPYCSHELEEGVLHLQKSSNMRWTPWDFSSPVYLLPKKKFIQKGGVIIHDQSSDQSLFFVLKAPALYCRRCNMFIIFDEKVKIVSDPNYVKK